jgi:hypothetical protein
MQLSLLLSLLTNGASQQAVATMVDNLSLCQAHQMWGTVTPRQLVFLARLRALSCEPQCRKFIGMPVRSSFFSTHALLSRVERGIVSE